MKTILFRQCCISRQRFHRNELLKITRINDYWYFDQNQELRGRSFYIHPDFLEEKKFNNSCKRYKLTKENIDKIWELINENI